VPSSAETKLLRDFVKRHCAITTTEDGQEKTAEGYFRFDVGRTSKDARKKGANVEWGEPETTFETVTQRVAMLAGDGYARIYVRAVGHADSWPMDSVTVEGDPEAALDLPADPKGQFAVNEAVAAVMLGQQRSMDRLVERLERVSEERQEQMVNAGLYMLAAQGHQDGSKMAQVQALMSALAPTFERTVPMLVAAWLGVAPPPEAPPPGADPGVVVDHTIVELDSVLARMAAVFAAHPTTATAERFARITAILAKYGGGGSTRGSSAPPQEDQARSPVSSPPEATTSETAG
jgi:hypothetical protein